MTRYKTIKPPEDHQGECKDQTPQTSMAPSNTSKMANIRRFYTKKMSMNAEMFAT